MRSAVFFDKDGTLIKDTPGKCDADALIFEPGFRDCLSRLADADFQLFVISNQPGIELKMFSDADLTAVLTAIEDAAAVRFSGFYYCPHAPAEDAAARCLCRKPSPELVLTAAREHNIDLRSSWFVGDILNDVEAGKRAGCRTILIDNGNETEWLSGKLRQPDHIVKDLSAAADIILTGRDI